MKMYESSLWKTTSQLIVRMELSISRMRPVGKAISVFSSGRSPVRNEIARPRWRERGRLGTERFISLLQVE